MPERTIGCKALTINKLGWMACMLVASGQVAWAGDSAPSLKRSEATTTDRAVEVQAILELTNRERSKVGLPPLKADNKLMKVAADHSANMARRNSLNHSMDGRSPFDRMSAAGYNFAAAGENIAFGASSPEEVVRMWMSSPGHRANILSRQYSEIGIGVAGGGGGRSYHTQVFGTPIPSRPGGRSLPGSEPVSR